MLEHNLFAQVAVAIVCTVAFLVILEGFGFTIAFVVRKAMTRLEAIKGPIEYGLTLRLFLGGLSYALVFLLIGSLGLLTKMAVIVVSCLVPLLAFGIGRRWRNLGVSSLLASYRENRYSLWGSLAFLIFTLPLWFRPVTNFDPLWYHLAVPKLFLQHHNTAYQGSLISYSLQPSMDYFWNLWPLSMPVSTPIASIIVNTIQAFVLCTSLAFASQVGKAVWGWSKFQQFIAPLLIGGTFETLAMLGVGGNDLYGVAFGLVAVLYCFWLLTKPRVSWTEFTCGILLIVGLATIKIFFTMFAVLVLAYFLFGVWEKLNFSKRGKPLLRVITVLAIIFIITYLPWLVRSYGYTHRLLDPLGTPGFNEGVYRSEGGGTPVNHWTNFVFTRFYDSIWPMLTFTYSPLALLGVLSIFSSKLRKQATNLWLVSFVGLLTVFFASIALQWRYYLPAATLLVFLGFVLLTQFSRGFDIFGQVVVWAVFLFLFFATIGRVMFSASDTTGFPSINQNLYISHFTTVDDYLDQKLSPQTYDYVQQVSPADLGANEKIYIGNSYVEKGIPIYGMMKLAYVKNPILDHTIDYQQFAGIKSAASFEKVLKGNGVRYVLTRDSMGNVCKIVGVKDYKRCLDHSDFKPVLNDSRWDVEWYKLGSS